MNISKVQKRNITAQYFPELHKYEFETKTILTSISFLKTQELLGATEAENVFFCENITYNICITNITNKNQKPVLDVLKFSGIFNV